MATSPKYSGTPGASYPLKLDHDADGDIMGAITMEHLLIHEGKMFSGTAVNTALASSTSLTYLLVTSATKGAHVTFGVNGT